MKSLHDAMLDPELFGNTFADESFTAWRTVAKILDGLPLTDDELQLYRHITGRTEPPHERFDEAYLIKPRRSGGTLFGGALGLHAALTDYRPLLGPGEVASVALVASDRKQARQLKNYINGLIEDSPIIAAEVTKNNTEVVEFTHRSVIEVFTGSFRATRGYSFACVLLDEIAYLRDETSAIPDVELVRAVRPGLTNLRGRLLGFSSPHSRRGHLWTMHRKHYGKESDVLVIKAGGPILNPTLDQKVIDRARAEDPVAARSEWDAEFREDLSVFLDDELVEAAIVPGRRELPFAGQRYFAFADPSGGRHDSFSLSIAHRDGQRIIQDKLLCQSPPFVPDEVVERYCDVLKSYGLATVTGDAYAGEWVSASFAKHGISYVTAAKDRSGIYIECLPNFTARNLELLDVPKLATELRLLERRPRPGGKGDVVDHPPRGTDDAANAACGSLWLAAQEATEDAAQVIPSAWIRAAQERWKPEPPRGIPLCAIGVGVRGYLDPVIAVRHDGWYAPLGVIPSYQTPHGRDLAALVMRFRKGDALPVIDVGESLGAQAFAHLKDNEVKAYAFRALDEVMERTAEKQMEFADKRAAVYWRFREALDPANDSGSPISLPDDPELVAQLEAVRWEQSPNGIKVESKEKVEAKLRRPSNRADAVVLAWYKGARAITHIQEWLPDERVPGFGRKRRPQVNMGPRRSGILSHRRR